MHCVNTILCLIVDYRNNAATFVLRQLPCPTYREHICTTQIGNRVDRQLHLEEEIMSEILAIRVMEALARRDPAVLQLAQPDATASGGVLPGVIPLSDAMNVMDALWDALSDFNIEIDRVHAADGDVRVEFTWSGTHTTTLHLPIPSMSPIPSTGKLVKVADVFVFRFIDDKIASVWVQSPIKGGIPGMLQQLGVVPA